MNKEPYSTHAERTTPEGVAVIWYKTQRVLRTAFAVLTTALTVWAGFALAAPQILAELALVLPGSWVAWLTATIASITVVAGVLTRIMAIPFVNRALIRIGLGSVPRSAVVQTRAGDVAYVLPDPRAHP